MRSEIILNGGFPAGAARESRRDFVNICFTIVHSYHADLTNTCK